MKKNVVLFVILLATLVSGCSKKSPVPIPQISICSYSCQSQQSYCSRVGFDEEPTIGPIEKTPIAMSINDYRSLDNFFKDLKKYYRGNQALILRLAAENPQIFSKLTRDEKLHLSLDLK